MTHLIGIARLRTIFGLMALPLLFAASSHAQTSTPCPAPQRAQAAPDTNSAFDERTDFLADGVQDWPVRTRLFLVRVSLSRLFYDVDVHDDTLSAADIKLCSAIREFQTRIGSIPTGILTAEQFLRLAALSARVFETELVLPHKFVGGEGDLVMAEGTWTAEGEKLAFPLNTSTITCTRENATCLEVSVTVVGDAAPSLVSSFRTFYTITRWSEQVIEARAGAACADTTLTINRTTGNVFSINQTVDRPECSELGRQLVDLKRPARLSTLADGVDIARAFYKTRRDELLAVIPPEARALLQPQ